MMHTSEIILDRQALQYNINFIKEEMGQDVLISSVVKGNAYGHGIGTFAPLAAEAGLVRHFSVFSAAEALQLRPCIQKEIPIMIMGFVDDEELEWAINNDIEFFVFDIRRLSKAIAISKKVDKKAKIHIELETGMNRTGFNRTALLKEVFPFLGSQRQWYCLKGICTHFAGAESIANYVRLEAQKKLFLNLRELFSLHGLVPEYTHTCCSAAAIRFEDMRFNMVRIGILQYGLWPNQEIKIEYMRKNKLLKFDLQRVLSWTSRLMTIKWVELGEFIGYGSSYQASCDMPVGIVPVGYANGYSRALSNSGRVIINGVRAGVIGTVNMNALMVDLTNVPNARVGDEVILIGEDGTYEVSVASFGELSNQLNYELLTRLPMDIPRRVL